MKITAATAHSRIATKVRNLREKAGLTQAELADKSGVGRRFVRELEGGEKRTLQMNKVNQVLAYFGYHLEVVQDGYVDV
jgi:y4mF family transcriptional regulator